MKFNFYFDNVYVINLKHRTDRLKSVSRILSTNSIRFERFDAVDGSKFNSVNGLLPGVIGCKHSHINILKDMVEHQYKQIAIFEDDVILKKNFTLLFEKYYAELPNNWDFVYLGGNNMTPPIKISTHIYKPTCTYALHGYILKLSIAKELLDNKHKFIEQIDVEYNRYLQDKNAFIFAPKLAFQQVGYSDNLRKYINYNKYLK
ncbi:MAG: glycosyltransferase family 25 protein [Bacteroidia bacterium]|nr:glycosyltransferase family 25 protein [Bacteroidia bacterium]